ncbi:MAG: hypothetical protein DWH71_03400 [Planctomycetota bacterium]|nr:MAG: hypothetical protein DWH71_03400 [Planctomycetota bacterium]
MASAPVFILRGALRHYGCLLARIRLTRTAAERGPVLFGERGQRNGFQTLLVNVISVCEPPQ